MWKPGGWATPVFKGWATLRCVPILIHWINPDQPLLVLRVKRKTAPHPLPRDDLPPFSAHGIIRHSNRRTA